jgi:hypothetical protein
VDRRTEADTGARLQRLQAEGAQALAPVRWHHLCALQARLGGQPEAVRAVLQPRLDAGVTAYADAWHAAQTAAGRPAAAPAPASAHADVRRSLAALGARADADVDTAAPWPPLRSARRFADTWALVHAESQVRHALGRGPANAGPLNPHLLMLRALRQMRDLSPAYLRHFLTYADTLLTLDTAAAALRPPDKGARRARVRR